MKLIKLKIGKDKIVMVDWEWHPINWLIWSSHKRIIQQGHIGIWKLFLEVRVYMKGPISVTITERKISCDIGPVA